MEPTYARVFENDGFKNIATALRRATVGEQYQKSQGRQQFEIRYGLFQDLERKARFKGDFLMAISKFIMDYDLENARFEEKLTRDGRAAGNVRRRPRVTTHDLANLTQLMDDMGAESKSEVVAMLLLAYASARDPREPGAARAPEAATVDDTIEPLGDSPVEDDQVERAE